MKELEERGIGRPSTYATILSTIQERAVRAPRLGGKFTPTEIGLVVTDLLVDNFKDIFDPQYTARLEEELDEIEEGKEKWTDALREFYKKFEQRSPLRRKAHGKHQAHGEADRRKVRTVRLAAGDQVGQARLVLRLQSYDKNDPELLHVYQGKSRSTCRTWIRPTCRRRRRKSTARTAAARWCSSADVSASSWRAPGYPDCKTTRRLDQGKKVPDVPLDEKCPQCERNLLLRHGRYGEFVACTGYPECKYVKQNFIGMKCPECKDGELVEKRARSGATPFTAARIIPSAISLRPPTRWRKPARSAAIHTWCRKFYKEGPVIACPKAECDYSARRRTRSPDPRDFKSL